MTVLSPSAEERLQTVLSRLATTLGSRISTAPSVLEEHSHGEAMEAARLP